MVNKALNNLNDLKPVIGQVLNAVLVLYISAIIGYEYGAEELGKYAVDFQTVLILSIIISGGKENIANKNVVRWSASGQEKRISLLIGVARSDAIRVTLLLSIPVLALYNIFFETSMTGILILILSAVIKSFLNINIAILRGLDRRNQLVWLIPLYSFITALIISFQCMFFGPIFEFFLIFFVSGLISYGVSKKLLCNQYRSTKFQRKDSKEFRNNTSMIIMLIQIGSASFGLYFASISGAKSDAGYISALMTFSSFLVFFQSAYLYNMTVDISKYIAQRNKSELKKYIQDGNQFLMTFTVPQIVMALILIEPALHHIYNFEIENVSYIVMIIVFGVLINVGSGPVGMYLLVTDGERVLLLCFLIGFFANVAAVMLFYDKIGIVAIFVGQLCYTVSVNVLPLGLIALRDSIYLGYSLRSRI